MSGTTSSGLFRVVDIYDDYVVKKINQENIEIAECDEQEAYIAQANEIAIHKDYPNNLCFAPVLEGSTIKAVKMLKVDEMPDYFCDSTTEDSEEATYILDTILEALGYNKNERRDSIWEQLAENVILPCTMYEKEEDAYIDFLDFVKNFVIIYKQDKSLAYALMDDCHVGNLGIFNHRVVMLDYGCVSYTYDEDYTDKLLSEVEE